MVVLKTDTPLPPHAVDLGRQACVAGESGMEGRWGPSKKKTRLVSTNQQLLLQKRLIYSHFFVLVAPTQEQPVRGRPLRAARLSLIRDGDSCSPTGYFRKNVPKFQRKQRRISRS